MIVRRITAEECLPLRGRILRPGQPITASRYPGEADGAGVHFGAFRGEELVTVVTAHPEDSPRFPVAGQWRIRGMATLETLQGQGFGAAALRALLAWGREEGIPLFWCNARERAIPFYERHGFTVESELFELPLIGPHRVLKVVP